MTEPVGLHATRPGTRPSPIRAGAQSSGPVVASTARPTLPQLLQLVARLAESGPPIDFARIAQLKRAIADGSYAVDASALAKAIVQFGTKA